MQIVKLWGFLLKRGKYRYDVRHILTNSFAEALLTQAARSRSLHSGVASIDRIDTGAIWSASWGVLRDCEPMGEREDATLLSGV